VEKSIGLRLPADYKLLLEDFGSGYFNGFLYPFNSFIVDPLLQLEIASSKYAEIDRRNRAGGISIPCPIYPEPGGMLAWGKSDNGDVLFWLTDPTDEPDRWAIVASESRGPRWFAHPGPMSEFLVDLLTEAISIPFFGPEQIGGPPRFESFDL